MNSKREIFDALRRKIGWEPWPGYNRWSTYNEQLRVFEGKCFECGTHYEVREQEAATGYIPCPKCKEKAQASGGKS
jgi:hypothetical protein